MSYSVSTPCGVCGRSKEGCTDGVVITGAVQGIIHQMPAGAGHKGYGAITMNCGNQTEMPKETEPDH